MIKDQFKKIINNFSIIVIFLIVVLCTHITGCSLRGDEIETNKQTYAMGTVVSFKVYGKNGEENIEAITNKIMDIENRMSINKTNSEISKLNFSAGKHPEKVSKETYSVIERALKYSKLSEGDFDITVEPLVKLWGIGTDKARIPSKEEIQEAKKLIDYKNVQLKGNGEVYLKDSKMEVDLGAIAKGYAADEVKNILKERKVKSAFINIGGNINLLGKKPNGDKWKIGIQNPLKQRGEYLGVLTEEDKSIVTSGNYERYFEKNGKRYHHIFDVKTGYPAEKGLISTTIVSDLSIDGDALSTTTYVLGLEKSKKLIESLNGVEAIFVTDDNKVYVTSGLKNKFKLVDEEFKLVK